MSDHPYLGRCRECDYALFATAEQIKSADTWKDITAGTGPYRVPNYGVFARCPARHKVFPLKQITGTYSKVHQCDSRCLNAKGHDCTCSCGGMNHGRGYAVEIHTANEPVYEPQFIGEVGKHIRGEVKVVKKIVGPQSANTTLYVFHTTKGDIVKWWAPSFADPDWKEGDVLTIRAKVKRHEDHPQYGKSTTVTYVERV